MRSVCQAQGRRVGLQAVRQPDSTHRMGASALLQCYRTHRIQALSHGLELGQQRVGGVRITGLHSEYTCQSAVLQYSACVA